MPRRRPHRLHHIQGIGVDQMGQIADASDADYLRLENLDVNIPPDPEALDYSESAVRQDEYNSYLPFLGKRSLRDVAASHVSRLSGVEYSGDRNCIISAGGLSGILNVLLATVEEGDEVIVTDPTYRGLTNVEEGDEVIVTDPTYRGLTNRVLLAGGIPKFVPYTFSAGNEWKLDQDALRAAISPKTSAVLLMSPSMPSGGYFTSNDWSLISELCVENNLLLILDTAMERLLFDGRSVIHPAGLRGMAERTVTIGSASKELRMIGWRVGWIVGPEELMGDIAAVSMANVVVPVGIAQDAVAIALDRSKHTMHDYVAELQARRDLIVSELGDLPVGIPAGGWSLLLRVSDFGIDGATCSQKLLEHGVCATAMDGWGQVHGSQYVRFVFSNEMLDRLRGIGDKVRKALGISS